MQWRKPLKVVADVGKTRVVGTVLKSAPLTVTMKLEPIAMIETIRAWFMEHGVSLKEYRNMLKELGITRDGITKRHKIKHRVTYAGE
jgi:hypothetical protein